MHTGAGGVQRQPDDAVCHLGDGQRQGDLTPVGADGDQIAVGGVDSPERATAAAAAGADAVAVIRAAWAGGSLAPLVAAVDAGRARR